MTHPHIDRTGARIRELVRARAVAEGEHDAAKLAEVDAELERLGVRTVDPLDPQPGA